MQHRGQDDLSTFADENVAMGYLRLTIIGLEKTNIPIKNEDGTIFVIVNGEFYDYKSIRNELIARGHTFTTNTDSEILVHLYEDYGLDCMKYLNGEFAFLLYDKKEKCIIAGRDRFGVKPLYYAYKDGEIYFSSEIKGLIAAGIESRLDNESFLISCAMQYTLPNKTLFKNINQLEPGILKIVSLENKLIENTRRYWDIDFTEGNYAEQDLLNILVDSIKTRLVSDVPVCCALSGGLDSSIVYGVANSCEKINAVCVEFENSIFNESEIAKRTASHFGTEIHILNLNSKKVIDNFSDAIYFSEGLTINSHLVAKYLLSGLIKEKGYKVVLTGEGSDELFLGYPHFKKDLNLNYNLFEAENRISLGIMTNTELPNQYIGGYNDMLGYVPDFLRVKSTFGTKVIDLLKDDFKEDFKFNEIPQKLLSKMSLKKIKTYNPANASAYIWTKIVLANYILRTLADGTEMAHTIEGRVPFLDHRLWDIAGKIPIKEKVRGTIEKSILREISKPYITEEVYKRVKQPFITPPLLIEQKKYLQELVLELPNIFDKEKINKLIKELYSKNDVNYFSKYEAVLFFIYSFLHLVNRFKIRI